MPRSVSSAACRAGRVTISTTNTTSTTRSAGGSPQCRHPRCTRRAIAAGCCRDHHESQTRWQTGGFTDAGPVRRHVWALLDAGVSLRAIHCVTGVDHHALAALIVAAPDPGTWPQGRIPAADAHRILDIPVPTATDTTTTAAEPAGAVPAIGSGRRLRALVTIGHPPDMLARRLGLPVEHVGALLSDLCRSVDADITRRVCVVFEELQMRPGPCQASRDDAADRGWDAPLAWDDHTIDNPAAAPHRERRKPLFDELFCELRDMGLRPLQIAERMGITLDSLSRQLIRYGMSQQYPLAAEVPA